MEQNSFKSEHLTQLTNCLISMADEALLHNSEPEMRFVAEMEEIINHRFRVGEVLDIYHDALLKARRELHRRVDLSARIITTFNEYQQSLFRARNSDPHGYLNQNENENENEEE